MLILLLEREPSGRSVVLKSLVLCLALLAYPGIVSADSLLAYLSGTIPSPDRTVATQVNLAG